MESCCLPSRLDQNRVIKSTSAVRSNGSKINGVKMPETKMILDKLQAHGKKLDRMETTLVQLAVQDSEIRHMQNQIVSLWSKIDLAYDPGWSVYQNP